MNWYLLLESCVYDVASVRGLHTKDELHFIICTKSKHDLPKTLLKQQASKTSLTTTPTPLFTFGRCVKLPTHMLIKKDKHTQRSRSRSRTSFKSTFLHILELEHSYSTLYSRVLQCLPNFLLRGPTSG